MMPTTPMELITTLGMLYIGAEYAHANFKYALNQLHTHCSR